LLVRRQAFFCIFWERSGDDPLKLFKKAVENCKPLLEVKTRRVGGANYQVPVEVNADRRTSLAIRWLFRYSRARGEKRMTEKLSNELIDSANGRRAVIAGLTLDATPLHVVQAALEGLAHEPFTIVATLPAGDPARFIAPANARVERFIPHAAVLDRAVCAVTHAGMGATQKALARGVPEGAAAPAAASSFAPGPSPTSTSARPDPSFSNTA